MRPKLKKIIRISFISATVLVLLVYLLTCLVPFLNAGKYPYIALMGLAFPLVFLGLLAFIIYWGIKKSKWALICMAISLLGWRQISVFFSFHTPKKMEFSKSPETLRVLSWNLSSWGESNRGIKKNYMSAMIDLIKNSQADVICLQEYIYYKNSKYRDSIIPTLKESGYKYAYFAKTNFNGRLYTTATITAVVIMSKYPITDTLEFICDTDNYTEPLIYADIKVNQQIIRVFTSHLQSVKFENHDYETLHKLKEPVTASINQARSTAWKLRNAYKKRAIQAAKLNEKIKESPYPVIVCGDFNDVPNSYTYFTIRGNLQDAFLTKGSGFGRTFRHLSPTLRIDYILADKKFEVQQFNTLQVKYSDHFPVIADFEISEK